MPGSWTIHVRTRTGQTMRLSRAKLARWISTALGSTEDPHIAPHLADAVELFLRRRGRREVSSGALTEMCLAVLRGLGQDAAAQELDDCQLPTPALAPAAPVAGWA